MYRINVEKADRRPRGDHVLIASIFLLTGLGLVTLYSASYAFAARHFESSYYFIFRQLAWGAAGLALFFPASLIKPEILRKLMMPMVLGTLVLCVLTLVPGIGVTKNGASRWIAIGEYTYQPSELVKMVLPLYLAHIFDKKQGELNSFSVGILPPVLVTAVFFSLICLQNNFSTAVFIALNALLIFFLAGVRIRYFIGALAILLPLSSFLILTKAHRLRRFVSFLWPEWDPQGAGYQARSSLLTISSGGFWGKGIGLGTRKIASVPEIQSDFIFSAFTEEFGFLGVLLFFVLLGIFAVRGYRGALRQDNTFRRLAIFGLVTMVVSQSLLNIAVTAGAVPATGIPLPFFSAGGSSLATTLIMTGIIVNISRLPAENRIPSEAIFSEGPGVQNVR
ncbi:MAG: putative lipid II flippase FtsW [Treponema sp.]|jgi:cell division protein FtsW|nr:putative lipid II flippase FtsW [Treponema sp.]